jgi:hypothetical protein
LNFPSKSAPCKQQLDGFGLLITRKASYRMMPLFLQPVNNQTSRPRRKPTEDYALKGLAALPNLLPNG